MIQVKGNEQCFFIQEPNRKDINGLSGEIVGNKVKIILMYKPDNIVEWLFSKEIHFEMYYFGNGARILIDLENFRWI